MGGDGAFTKAAKRHRRTHRERAQPVARSKNGVGLLEKHKDYVARARNYHAKQAHLKQLMEKARFRNPDEFYFKMIATKTRVRKGRTGERPVHAATPELTLSMWRSTRTHTHLAQGGVHASSPNARTDSLDMDTAKLLKTQDANYITAHASAEAKVWAGPRAAA